ncbi:glutaminase A [Synechococcus sp. RSCCF101]|uniref:glutaminase A n=1 Tax=Synechococcus sp. RSCCF101 TaxID=2511069 RepID=UPI0012449DAC|nr:glutaminase A [Synechococcus sp. RSCCF101]QEY30892.1 glutaminase A [Synechococcus sp. RSCCF101]QEY33246.1 glutaminase A [Synechococcus sp. RSCCF101]
MPTPAATSSLIQGLLNEVHQSLIGRRDGRLADYIPELARASPDAFGIAVATSDGRLYSVGDSETPFTIQSISKPFSYALALSLLSPEKMLQKVGVEPSGEAFNAISLDPDSGIPMNPMINAGAIATTAQIWAHDPDGAEAGLLAFYAGLAGRPLEVDEAVFRSERDSGHRNRAIGHLLRNAGIIETDPEASLQLYFRQCSVQVTCRDLAVMASCLACQGRHPFRGTRVIDPELSSAVLAVMGSCGMYDYSGQWLHTVGMPAKSGVGGGLLAVVPGQLGLAVYSPPLDAYGNSVRGVAVCEELSRRWQLHLFDQPPRSGTTIRSATTACTRHSRHWRDRAECAVLDRCGDRIRVLQVQGVLDFAATEELLAYIEPCAEPGSFLVLDLAGVLDVSRIGIDLLRPAFETLHRSSVTVLLCGLGHLADPLQELLRIENVAVYPGLDPAIEAAETLLLEDRSRPDDADDRTGPEAGGAADLLGQLPDPCPGQLARLMEVRCYAAGETVCRAGSEADALFVIEAGSFSAVLDRPGAQRPVRLATFGPGVCFGEVAFVTGSRHGADVVSETEGCCRVLSRAVFEQLERSESALALALMRLLYRETARKLTLASQQLSLLEQPEVQWPRLPS